MASAARGSSDHARILTGSEASLALAGLIGIALVTHDPVQAQGRALAGRCASSLGTAPAGSARGLGASCVHLVTVDDGLVGGDVAAVLVATTVQEAVDLALVGHRVSAALGAPVSVLMPGGLADRAEPVILPAQAAARDLVVASKADVDVSTVVARSLDEVGVRVGRPLAAAWRTGPGGHGTVVIAVGPAAARARAMAEGADLAVISLACLAPFPAEALRAAIGHAGEVVVIDPPGRAGRLSNRVRDALEVGVRVVTASGRAAGVRAALAPWLPQAPSGTSDRIAWQLAAVPAGPWGRRALRRLAEHLNRDEPEPFDARATEDPVATRLGVDPGAGAGERQVREVVLAVGPEVLSDGALLGALSEGSTVIVASTASGPREVAHRLGPVGRAAARDRSLALWWVAEPGAQGVGEAAGSVLHDGTGATRVAAEDLDEARHVEEIDFHRIEVLPRFPASVTVDEATRVAWRVRVRDFWAGRASPAELAPEIGARPLSLDTASATLRARHAWPVVLDRRADDLVVRNLIEVVATAAEAAGAHEAAARSAAIAARVALGQGRGPLALQVAVAARAVLGEGDDVGRLVDRLSPELSLLAWGPSAPVALMSAALDAHRGAAWRRLVAESNRLHEALAERLRADDDASGTGRTGSAVRASLGALGAQLDVDALAQRVRTVRGSRILEPTERADLEATLAALADPASIAGPRTDVVLVHGPGLTPALPAGARAIAHPHPTGAAVGVFDALVADYAPLFLAIRRATRVVDGRPGPSGDIDPQLLDWEALTADELAALPTVVVLLEGRPLRDRGAGGLVALVRSSRPVSVLVLDTPDDARPAELSQHHLSLGTLAVSCREALVVQGSLARPRSLVEGLTRLARARRPGVAVVTAAHGPLGSLRAEAAVRGRGAPQVCYDPDQGDSWSDRLDLSDNPQPALVWPRHAYRVYRGDEVVSLDLAFTWADAVALAPAYREHLAPLPPDAWDDETQAPLDEVLATWRPGAAEHRVPWILGVDDAGTLCRMVVSRELAAATLEHARAWRFLQELAGYDNPLIEAASTAAREQAEAAAQTRIAALQAEHEVALAQMQEQTARESLGRLAAALLSTDGAALVAAPVSVAPVLPAPPPVVEAEAPEPEPPPPDDDDEVLLGDPWVDTPMCTTCNECTNLNPRLFVYNADKQVVIGDVTAGTFEDLVRGAEKCPARCIHPGRPRPGDGTATADLVQRAAPFQ